MNAGNTASEVDKIPPLLIKKVLPILKNKITLLFQLCLEKRY